MTRGSFNAGPLMFLTRRLLLGSLGASLLPLSVRAQGDSSQTDPPAPPEPAPTPEAAPKAEADGFRLLETRKGGLRLQPEPAAETDIWGYNGTVPGPLLRYKKGEEVKIRLVNRLDQPTSIHWHGVRITNAMDGVANLTQEPVAPGASFDCRFTPPDSGLFWYHPDIQPLTGEELDRGLYGVLIVDEAEPPKVDRDMLVVLDDWKLGDKGAIAGDYQNPSAAAAGAGRIGSLVTVNSAPIPVEETMAPGSRLRLRLLSTATARLMVVSFVGVRPQVIAMDGQPCEAFEPVHRTLPIGPGARFDLVFDLPGDASTESNLILRGDGVPDQTLLTWKTKGDKRADLGPLPTLGSNPLLPTEIHLEKSTKVDLVIEGGTPPKEAAAAKPSIAVSPKKSARDGGAKAAQLALPASPPDPAHLWTINGIASDGHAQKPLFSVKRGTSVTLGFINKTGFVQQMHVHGHVMRILHDLDDGWEPYWRDAILIAEGRTKHVAFVADNPGKWAIESSMTDRAASGLATWFEVT